MSVTCSPVDSACHFDVNFYKHLSNSKHIPVISNHASIIYIMSGAFVILLIKPLRLLLLWPLFILKLTVTLSLNLAAAQTNRLQFFPKGPKCHRLC